MITTSELRSLFLKFFQQKNHMILPSSHIVPSNDPTLMFTNAGMVQFKDIFTGQRTRPAPCAATVQKCIRISGKHNDLENVGRTSRHHTFFEMLGNFSFGDYFKKDACLFAYELLTKELGLDPNRLWFTVFEGDENVPADTEAEAIWRDVVKVPPDRIIRMSAKDNFWAMGDTGPCGPCSEIHYDRGDAFGPADMNNSERFFEIWNLVFMQFNVSEPKGPLVPLAKPCIDTGAGLERIASVLQGVASNYDIDIFAPLLQESASIASKPYGKNANDDISIRVIADHARMTAFLIAEGVFPEKTGREYVLRRVMRRAVRHAHKLGIEDLFMHKVAARVVETMSDAYPELSDRSALIEQVCRQEEERFRATLGRGLELLSHNKDWLEGPNKEKMLPGETAFDLTATYGFPRDLIDIIGQEEGFILDENGYAKAEEKHKAVSGAGKIGDKAVSPVYNALIDKIGRTEFVGYNETFAEVRVAAIVKNNISVEKAETGDTVDIIFNKTPFYGESGGQVGDTGELSSETLLIKVHDVTRPINDLFVHHAEIIKGALKVGDNLKAQIDECRRNHIRRHHSATHLCHFALRQVLGPHATQKGSRVDAERLRFDFSHFEPLTGKQLAQIEYIVAQQILENAEVYTSITTYDEARSKGAMALFGERYEESVRMVSVSEASRELCGGTHVKRTGDIGACYIVAESGIAAGVRRIEAVAGLKALEYLASSRNNVEKAAALLKTAPDTLVSRVEATITKEKELTKEIAELKRKLASGGRELLDNQRTISGVKVVASRIEVGEPAALRDAADSLQARIGSGVVCLGGDNKGKAALVVSVSPDLTDRLKAGELIKVISEIVGGRGGGRSDFAQAGGPGVNNLERAIEMIYEVVERTIKP